MPMEVICFGIGLLLGYYTLSSSFRGIANQILYKLAQILHHLALWLLGLIVKLLNWAYLPQQKPLARMAQQIPQGYHAKTGNLPAQPIKTTAPKNNADLSRVKTVKLENGGTGFVLTPTQLEELMKKNPELKITEKEE